MQRTAIGYLAQPTACVALVLGSLFASPADAFVKSAWEQMEDVAAVNCPEEWQTFLDIRDQVPPQRSMKIEEIEQWPEAVKKLSGVFTQLGFIEEDFAIYVWVMAASSFIGSSLEMVINSTNHKDNVDEWRADFERLSAETLVHRNLALCMETAGLKMEASELFQVARPAIERLRCTQWMQKTPELIAAMKSTPPEKHHDIFNELVGYAIQDCNEEFAE